ncbi:site-specific integrase [Paraburkholderia nemoris]|uniref:site-specific integrase n=1 Tax=Paraburkholderia nemoris TaxID=2793076 RepID=UPI001B2779CC|nr:site-specific integrase [Paraburkholderia nemoris]CAE6732621.1 Tyrosine recombinase XerC [Paraburkholderia nemoris]
MLKVNDVYDGRSVSHLQVHGNGNRLRHVPLHPANAERIHTYLEVAGHGTTPDAPLFQPLRKTGASITADGVYKCVLTYAAQATTSVDGFGVHSLRATAATNALKHEASFEMVHH